ncbi:VanZ family protein [Lacticaseibacillus baoqingensis]|uniref:VanZ family protein n=1 Tax=Lacticaseibacillus baoqingensis TaxID=2486013 RepID=A0ABW4E9P8_9LACO|nr:VanZ family protein [Lacticaseibacillus baoqingensis]
MSAYLYPVKMAVITFPILALVLALPFLIIQYRRYGSFIFWRAFVVYSFVFYMLTAYFLIVLPLPSRAAVAALTTPKANVIPLTALREFLNTTVFSPLHPGTWLAAMKQPGFIQPVFNIVLTIPFGVYLRYYFKRPLKQILLLSFGLSLFFELTQLSGLYGYYPRPYRLFDVDDLICNSSGGLIGGLVAPTLMRAFPTRDEMDARSLAKGQHVGWLRRFVAFVVDNVVVVGIVSALLGLLLHLLGIDQHLVVLLSEAVIPLFFAHVLVPIFHQGATFGKSLVRIRLVKENGQAVGFWRLFLRAFLLYGVSLQAIRGFFLTFEEIFSKFHRTELNFALLALFGLVCAFLLVNFIWEAATRDNHYFYDVWAQTKQISTVKQAQAAND